MTNSKQGEQLFIQFIEQLGHIVEDLTADREFQIADIDFKITSPSGITKYFEVKYDAKINSTGNLFVEFFNAHNYGGLGWYEFCKADFISYGDAHTNTFYCFLLEDLRQLINSHKFNVATADNEKIAGYLVPLRLIENKESIEGKIQVTL